MNSRGPGHRPATLKDVAELANVSRQTISRVVNGKGEVSEATRKRVLKAIEELGYFPNTVARSLVTTKTYLLGLVVPDITQPFYPEIARGVEDGAHHANYSVSLSHTAADPARELLALERLRGHRVDGAIICNSRLDDDVLERVVTHAFPVVLVNRELANVPCVVIWPGYDRGVAMAVKHLYDLGRRKIAYLALRYPNRVDDDKLRGYRHEIQRLGLDLDPRLIIRGANSFRGGYESLEALMRDGVEIDGMVAFNDVMAVGALRYAAVHGVRVPEDLAIVGFGGSEITEMVTPAVSTIAVPLYSIGMTAVEELLSLIDGSDRAGERRYVSINPELVIRESTVPRAERVRAD